MPRMTDGATFVDVPSESADYLASLGWQVAEPVEGPVKEPATPKRGPKPSLTGAVTNGAGSAK